MSKDTQTKPYYNPGKCPYAPMCQMVIRHDHGTLPVPKGTGTKQSEQLPKELVHEVADKECPQCHGTGLHGFVHHQHMPCTRCEGTGRIAQGAEVMESFEDAVKEAFDRDCMSDKPTDDDGNHEHTEAIETILEAHHKDLEIAYEQGRIRERYIKEEAKAND